jgi:hypothetical protein
MDPCIVSIFQYISNKMQRYTVYLYLKLLYMFRAVLSPIIRSAYNCIYSIWHLSHRYCYTPPTAHSNQFQLFHDSFCACVSILLCLCIYTSVPVYLYFCVCVSILLCLCFYTSVPVYLYFCACVSILLSLLDEHKNCSSLCYLSTLDNVTPTAWTKCMSFILILPHTVCFL